MPTDDKLPCGCIGVRCRCFFLERHVLPDIELNLVKDKFPPMGQKK